MYLPIACLIVDALDPSEQLIKLGLSLQNLNYNTFVYDLKLQYLLLASCNILFSPPFLNPAECSAGQPNVTVW